MVDEGLRLHPYRDTVGKLTIGYGRNLDDKGISQAEADLMLANDAEACADQVNASISWAAALEQSDPVRWGVLVQMAFNMGMGGLLGFPRMLGMCEAGRWEEAAADGLASKWAGQVGERAIRLMAELRTGVAGVVG
jgi:lysozyme